MMDLSTAQTTQRFRNKLKVVLSTRWSTAVAEWNASQPATSTAILPPGPEWNITVGFPDGGIGSDTKPSIVVIFPSSSYSYPTTNTRQEDAVVVVNAYLPDAGRGIATTIDLAPIAGHIAAEIIEKYVVDSPGDDDTGVCYRVDFRSSRVQAVEGLTGAVGTTELVAKIRAAYGYRPVPMPTTILPDSFRSDYLGGFSFEIFDGATSVGTATPVWFGEIKSFTLTAATSLVVQPVVGSPWTHGIVTNDLYSLQDQIIPVSFSAGVATLDLTSFASYAVSETLTLRVSLSSSTTKRTTFFTVVITKS